MVGPEEPGVSGFCPWRRPAYPRRGFMSGFSADQHIRHAVSWRRYPALPEAQVRTRLAPLICAAFAMAVFGCGTARLYDGPALPPESVSIVEAPSSRATIERIDGEDVHRSAIELMPGDYELEFSWSTRKRISSLFPVMETNCYVAATLEPGRSYVFEQNDSREAVGRRPPQDFRWTLYRVDPKLLSDTGEETGEIICKPTCRAHGQKSSNERTSDCADVLEPRVVQPAENAADSESRQSPEAAALSRIIFDRLTISCADQRGIQEALCQVRRVPNNISYLSGDGTLLIFYPADATDLRPGLREEARSECLGDPPHSDTPACLNDFGWVLLR